MLVLCTKYAVRFIFVVNNLAIKVVLSLDKVLNKVISHYIISTFQNNYPLTNPAMPGLVKNRYDCRSAHEKRRPRAVCL